MFKRFRKKSKLKKQILPVDNSVLKVSTFRPKAVKKNYKSIREVKSPKVKLPRLVPKNKTFFKITLFVVLMVIVAGAFYLLTPKVKSLPYFTIKEVNVYGNKELKKEDLEATLAQFKGKNMFDIKEDDITDSLTSHYDYLKSVYVRKILPSKLEVEVVEKYPIIVLLNLDGMYLVDEELSIAGNLDITKLELSALDKKLLDKQVELNSETIQKKYYELNANDEVKKSLSWGNVPEDEKKVVLKTLEDELTSKIQNYLVSSLARFKESKFNNLTLMWTADNLDKNNFHKQYEKKLNFTLRIFDALSVRDFVIELFEWSSDYALIMRVDSSRDVIFSSERNVDDQIRDLEAIIWNNQFSPSRVFDIRTFNYSITQK